MTRKPFFPTLSSLLAAPGRPFVHRDLSWLLFNERVLAESRTSSNPLLERVKFLAISSSNLDEFFMIRFASLRQSIALAARKNPKDMEHLTRVRSSIMERVAAFNAKQAETLELLAAALEPHGVHIVRSPREEDAAFAAGRAVFEAQVLPNLPVPQALKPVRLDTLENLQIACVFSNEMWFPIPRGIPPAFVTEDNGVFRLFFLDDLLTSHLGPAFRLESPPLLMRVTRDADISVDLEEEDSSSIPDIVRTGLGSRERGRAVRLQYAGEFPEDLLNRCLSRYRLHPAQVLPAPDTMCLQGLWSLVKAIPDDVKAKKGLSHTPIKPFVLDLFERKMNVFDELKQRDLLFHQPYDSFEAYVRFIQEASEDADVEMIQQTVYRVDVYSPVMDALKAASAAGKKVRVVIELRARFDELNNLRIADDLRKAGIEVAFGFGKLKLHAKIASVVRRENGERRCYTHLSTGNYNASTARQYEDLAILTANTELGEDALHFFDSVCAGSIPSSFKRLVPAPIRLHRLLLDSIRRETEAARAKKPARIVAKVNALVDTSIIERLYEASSAGVQIDLIVRGACSLIPGVPHLSDNIRVISVVDRFLEHSRIYYFAHSRKMYLSSADWMPRNFFSRLELAFPVLDPDIYAFIETVVIPAYLADTVKARELTPQGTWKKRTLSCTRTPLFRSTSPAFVNQSVRAQFFFADLAERKYRDTPLHRRMEKKRDGA